MRFPVKYYHKVKDAILYYYTILWEKLPSPKAWFTLYLFQELMHSYDYKTKFCWG